MNKRNIVCFAVFAALVFGSFYVAESNNKKESKIVEGYSASSLPTTIDLNDTSASNIRSYYSSLNNLSTSERQGTNLLKNLKTILKNGQKYYSYDSGSAIWQIYEIADRDWAKSPASSTTYGTYNSTTNKITNYTYGTSSSSSKNNPYIHALYINRDVTNKTTAWDDHKQTQWGINREHVWPKAEGFDTSGQGGARGDPMHLMAGNGYANNIHSNYYYGYVKTSSSYTDCGSTYSNQSGNLRGTSKTLNTGTVFEPQDCDKGDIARAIFYMVARYNYLSGSDSDGIDANNPNLTLTQSISDWSNTGYTSSTSKTGKMGILTDLLNWHHQDPVDEYEIHRNNLLYTNYTNNRNPFIDFPEWVDFIWGTATYNGTTYVSRNTTPTGYATPSSDTINGYNGGSSDPVAVTGVTLNKDSTSIEVDGSEVLTATVTPSNATDQSLTWTSSNTNVATVSTGGRVTAVAEGSTTITVKTNDGNFTDTCTVTVTAASDPGGEGSAEGSVEADNGELEGWTTSGTGSYADEAVKFDSAGDNVYKLDIFSGEVSANMTSLEVTLNYKWYSGTGTAANNTMSVTPYINGSYGTPVSISNFSSSGYTTVKFSFDSGLEGCTGFKITYTTKGNGNIALKDVSWSAEYSSSGEPTLSSIAVKTAPTKTSYDAGEDFEPAGLVITATYSDASSIDVSYEDNEDYFEFEPADNLQTSDESVTITYGGKTCSQSITVSPVPTLTWDEPNINVFAGTQLTSTQANAWNVEYDNGAGLTTDLSYGDFSIKLGGSTISLPYSWQAGDDGKELKVTYSALTSSAVTVSVVQTINSVYAQSSSTWSYSFEEKIFEEIGSETIGGKTWTVSGTYDTTNNPYFGYDSNLGKGQQFGSGSVPFSKVQLKTSSFAGEIYSVTVYTSGANSINATVQVKVDGTAYGSAQTITSSNADYTFDLGGESGEIVIEWINSSSKAIYIKQIVVNYEGTLENIANVAGHEDAQRAVVKFAKAFNTAMDTTSGCTTNMSTAWSTATSAWNTFLSEAAALGTEEEAYAKNLIANANAVWTPDTDSNYSYCLERAMATYEKCVNAHGMTAFMSSVRTVPGSMNVRPFILTAEKTNSILIVTITTIITGLGIGGYFFLKRKKED